jgi:preprotein translocase subunit YajC
MIDTLRFALATATPTGSAAATDPTQALLGLVLPFALMFGVMWLVLIRPQRKKEKALKSLVNSMAVGDDAVTVGGVIGKVANIKDDEITLSTGPAKTLITFKKSAIASVIKPISD